MPLKTYLHALNVGVIDEGKQHRVDLETMRLAAKTQTNLIPLTTGEAFFRPGFRYYDTAKAGVTDGWLEEFVASEDEAFLLEFTDNFVRFRKASTGELVTRPNVSAVVPSGAFSASAGWTLNSASGQSSTISAGYLQLIARAHGAEAYGTSTINIAEQGTLHGINIEVTRGPITFRMGSSAGADDVIQETVLRTGRHSLAFTPAAATMYIKLSTKDSYLKLVNSCQIDATGPVALVTPYDIADLPMLQTAQSLDVMYLACRGYQRQRIERRDDDSWSIVDEDSDDGPFMAVPTSKAKISVSVLEGDVTLTSDIPFFTADMVGSLILLNHRGQSIDTYLAAADVYTLPIMVTGINEPDYNERDFTWTTAGTWTATVKVQRSFDSDLVGFQEFRREQGSSTINITTNLTKIDDDNEDNSIAWFRMGIEPGDFTSGEVHITMSYGGGQSYGIGRMSGLSSSTSMACQVLKPFGGIDATDDWRLGIWSDEAGWPSAVAFADGRLFWAGDDTFMGSIADAYSNFDETFVGDAGPILRAIAVGGRNESRWCLSMPGGMIVGTDGRLIVARANSLDDPMTPTDFKMSSISKIGVAVTAPVELADNRALFVEKHETALYELTYSPNLGRYVATPLSKLTTDIFASGIKQMAVSNLPDQRVWCLMNDGTMVCIVYEPNEKVVAFVPIETRAGDQFLSVAVVRDTVWVLVSRSVNGSTVYHIEQMASDDDVKVDAVACCMDSFVTGSAGIISTADHLAGETVVAWVDGAPVLNADGTPMEFTVGPSGIVSVPVIPTQGWCVGLPYEWEFEPARLEYGRQGATPVQTVKSIKSVGLLLSDYVRNGIAIASRNTEGVLKDATKLPDMVRGKAASNVVAGVGKSEPPVTMDSEPGEDNRFNLSGQSPNPVMIRGIVLEMELFGG